MKTIRLVAGSTVLATAAACLPAQAQTVWNEAVQGDLSNDGLSPTVVSIINAGDGRVVGTMGDGGSGVDRDYFTFTVPVGAQLSALLINPTTFVSGSYSFMAIQVGPQVTTTPTGGGIAALLGYNHYDNADAGTNFLPRLLQSHPELGGVLPSGTYSIWVQETGGTVPYDYTFSVRAVPEAGAAAMLAAGLLSLFALRRRLR